MTKQNDEAYARLEEAFKVLPNNPFADLILSGDGDPAQLLEASEVFVVASCAVAQQVGDRELQSIAKGTKKAWRKFLERFLTMAQNASKEFQKGEKDAKADD